MVSVNILTINCYVCIWSKSGERFVPGQVFETEDGPRFVPGKVIEVDGKVTFIAAQIVQTDQGTLKRWTDHYLLTQI